MRNICILISCFSICAQQVPAATVNLIKNGEFESPDIVNFAVVNSLPNWTSTIGAFEVWDSGVLTSPTIGSDGESTGQHLELDSGNTPVTFSQSFVVPSQTTGMAVFTFDAWLRSPGTSQYRVDGSISGTIVDLTPITSITSAWTENSSVFAVQNGEAITVSFVQGTSTGISGAHIDQVEFNMTAIPEPSSILLLGCVSTFGVLIRGRRVTPFDN